MSEFRPKVLARGTVCLPGDACAVTALWRSAILAPHGFCTQVTFYLQVSAGAPSLECSPPWSPGLGPTLPCSSRVNCLNTNRCRRFGKLSHDSTLLARKKLLWGLRDTCVRPPLFLSPRKPHGLSQPLPSHSRTSPTCASSSSKCAGEQVLATCWATGRRRRGPSQCLLSESPMTCEDIYD